VLREVRKGRVVFARWRNRGGHTLESPLALILINELGHGPPSPPWPAPSMRQTKLGARKEPVSGTQQAVELACCLKVSSSCHGME
jgi:hypothetical protein